MTDQELKDLVAGNATRMKELETLWAKTVEENRRYAEESRKKDEEYKRKALINDEKMVALGKQLGYMGNTRGEVCEEYFLNSIGDHPKIGNIQYDDINANQFKKRHGVKEEYDIVLTNCNYILVIEVKYKVEEKHIKIIERKVENYKKLFQEHSQYKIQGCLAGFRVAPDVVKKISDAGFMVMKRKGKAIETINENIKYY